MFLLCDDAFFWGLTWFRTTHLFNLIDESPSHQSFFRFLYVHQSLSVYVSSQRAWDLKSQRCCPSVARSVTWPYYPSLGFSVFLTRVSLTLSFPELFAPSEFNRQVIDVVQQCFLEFLWPSNLCENRTSLG